MRTFFVALSAIAILRTATSDRPGIDVSSNSVVSGDAFKCLRNKTTTHNADNIENKHLTIRISNSSGFIQASLETLNNAQVNINPIFALVELCPKKMKNSYSQLSDALNKLEKNNALDTVQYVFMSALQNPGDEDCWYTSGSADDTKKNIAALQSGMQAIRTYKKFLGVKTNKQNWTALTNDWNGISAAGWQLWWASEGPATFNDFVAFGGWSAPPALRQYKLSETECNIPINLDIARDDIVCNGYGRPCNNDCCDSLECRSGACRNPQ